MFTDNSHYISDNFDKYQLNTACSKLVFEACTFRSCDFSHAVFKHCQFVDCRFIECNLSNLQWLGCQFSLTQFSDCKMLGIDWTQVRWLDYVFEETVAFERCVLSDNSFFGLTLNDLRLLDCKVHRVDFREGRFCHADFSGSDFNGSLFGKTNLTQADFTGAENYHMDVTQNTLKQTKFSRYEAICLLAYLDIELVD